MACSDRSLFAALTPKVMVLTLALPLAALADISGSATLKSGVAGANTSLNLDTGKGVTSGGDIVWNGASIAPAGSAKLRNLGMLLTVQPASYYAQQAASATTTPIPVSQLTIGDVFVVLTNGGNTARVECLGILTVTGQQIILSFTTYVGVAPGVPIVNEVLNNSSQLPSYFPNYGIAPSSLFIVTGAFLANPGQPVLQSSAPPGLPATLNGASISVTVNGTTVNPAIYYTSPSQIAAVLPARHPNGKWDPHRHL